VVVVVVSVPPFVVAVVVVVVARFSQCIFADGASPVGIRHHESNHSFLHIISLSLIIQHLYDESESVQLEEIDK